MTDSKKPKVFYADLWGTREKKYDVLMKNDIETTKWEELKHTAPYYFFIPKDFSLLKEYEKFWKITDIFKEYSSGIQTKRDKLAISFDRDTIRKNFLMFQNINFSDEIIEKTFKISSTYEWHLKKAREEINKENIDKNIKNYFYRPFDIRWIYYSDAILARPFIRVMQHLLNKNIGICTSRKFPETISFGTMITRLIGDIHSVADQTYFFPLYLYPDKTRKEIFEQNRGERIPNFTDKFQQFAKTLFKTVPSPEEIFYYIYAVLYSPTYRKRYEEFLKIDFPRIPFTKNYKHFKKLSELGKELADLHLLKHSALNEAYIGFPVSGTNKVENVKYDETNKRVYINKSQYFDNISKEVWEYHIGAYQVMAKYLKDRKKRKLSLDEINHYMKVAKSIKMTIKTQKQIEKIRL